ncbi:hypothetical protein MTO96_027949 [Rhipicephalus appendiculatus]
MLPIVAVLLAVAVVLMSAGTIAWLYLRLVSQMYREDHKGSYEPAKTEEKVPRQIALSPQRQSEDRSVRRNRQQGRRSGRSHRTPASRCCRSHRASQRTGSRWNGSFAELDQSRTASGRFAPEHRLMTSTPADGVSLCRSTGPQVHTAYPGRSLRYAPTSAMEADHTQSAASETSATANPDKLVTRTIETTGSRSACTPTAITRREEATSENVEELSLSPMLWDYAGFEWPGKNREDVFTADVDPHTGSECSGVCCEDQEEEEDSDGHSSTSGVHRVLRKTERSYSCYPFVEHSPRQVQDPRCIEFVPPECALLHCSTAASTGSLPISEEDEADQAFFGKAQHDETYRQYLESIILKRKARMYYGPYGHIPHS